MQAQEIIQLYSDSVHATKAIIAAFIETNKKTNTTEIKD
jgi:hypothetical protein